MIMLIYDNVAGESEVRADNNSEVTVNVPLIEESFIVLENGIMCSISYRTYRNKDSYKNELLSLFLLLIQIQIDTKV